ncbi:12174_t:CDS:2, partial [Dentiscutata heterogama]
RNTWRSASYMVKDLGIIAVLVYAATLIDVYLPQTLRFFAWLVYWFFCGAFATGLWVIAHECGHQAFSPHKSINNTVGFILHSALLVPYHSWKITHAKHHHFTAHMDKDQVFVPKTRKALGIPEKDKDHDDGTSIFEEAPIVTLIMLILQQLFGWPLYLIFNASGQVYKNQTWNFVRGAACTVDRHFGFLDSIFHRISSTHVAHHYFSNMPHYHAEEATIYLKKVLGSYYIFDNTPIFKALWRSYNQCRFIEDEGE